MLGQAFEQRKERRPASVGRYHKGDYINLCLYKEITAQFNGDRILFADRILDVMLKGKKGHDTPSPHPVRLTSPGAKANAAC